MGKRIKINNVNDQGQTPMKTPAAADRGIIPKDLLDDHEVVRMLPAFFRTLRGQKPTVEEMTKLADKIRKS